MNKKSILIGLAIIILIVVLLAKPSTQKDPLKIGYVGSLTGDLQAWGEESRNSVALAVKEINQKGGVKGRPIEMIYEDGACNAAKAVTAARKLINIDGVKILIAWCSQEAMSIAPVAKESKVIEFVPDATVAELTNINDYVFRISPSDKVTSDVLSGLITPKYKRIAIITENSSYSSSLRSNFVSKMSSTSEVVFDETFDPGLRDFRSMIAKLKSTKPDAVFINATITIPAALITKQLSDAKVDAPYYGAYFGSDPEFIKIAGKGAEGFTYVEFIADSEKESVKKFLSAYKAEYGHEAPHPQFAALSYDAPYVLKQAIESAGDDPENLKIYFKNLKEVKTVLGDFKIINGDIEGSIFKVRTIENGKPINVK